MGSQHTVQRAGLILTPSCTSLCAGSKGLIGRDVDSRSLPRALGEDGPYQNTVVSMSCWEFLRSSLQEDEVSLPSRAAGRVITIVKR